MSPPPYNAMNETHDRESSLPAGLPKFIEGAAARYLGTYKDRFRGSAREMKRLRSMAEGKIILLRKKAPMFYEDHLPTLLNQAASKLLTCDMSTESGQTEFNNNHAYLLKVLDELARTQPNGAVDFEAEKERVQRRENYLKDHLKLHQEVSKMEATEIDFDEIGDDDPDSVYSKFYQKLDEAKDKLRKVSLIIARMEGERIDEEPEFELRLKPRSSLHLLSQEKLADLEKRIKYMLQINKEQKKTAFVNHETMEQHIKALDLAPAAFNAATIKDLVKDTLDAFTTFYRDIENKRREAYHESLISNPTLKPKEGEILKGPNDLPEDVLRNMERADMDFMRKFDELTEKYSERDVDADANEKGGDLIADEDNQTEDHTMVEVERLTTTYHYDFNRVKEEPRDDYENDYPSDEETFVPQNAADSISTSLNCYKKLRTSSDRESGLSGYSNGNNNLESLPSTSQQLAIEEAQGNKSSLTPPMEVLGVVEPGAKHEVITIDDD